MYPIWTICPSDVQLPHDPRNRAAHEKRHRRFERVDGQHTQDKRYWGRGSGEGVVRTRRLPELARKGVWGKRPGGLDPHARHVVSTFPDGGPICCPFPFFDKVIQRDRAGRRS